MYCESENTNDKNKRNKRRKKLQQAPNRIKKNNLNDSATLYIPQYTQTNTHHPFVCMPTGHSSHNNTKQQFQIICSAVF